MYHLIGRHTAINCCLHLTNVQHSKFYVFYSVISKIGVNLPLIKFYGKNIIQGNLDDFIDIIIFKYD